MRRFRANVVVGSLVALLAFSGAFAAGSEPEPAGTETGSSLTIVQGARLGETVWAVTDFLPGGVNTPFVGVPDPEFMGADVVEFLLDDVRIPKLHQPVTVGTLQIILNERNIEPLEVDLDGDGVVERFNFYFVLDPAEDSTGVLTLIQTRPDDHGGPDSMGSTSRSRH